MFLFFLFNYVVQYPRRLKYFVNNFFVSTKLCNTVMRLCSVQFINCTALREKSNNIFQFGERRQYVFTEKVRIFCKVIFIRNPAHILEINQTFGGLPSVVLRMVCAHVRTPHYQHHGKTGPSYYQVRVIRSRSFLFCFFFFLFPVAAVTTAR